jgi:hypothetical protein
VTKHVLLHSKSKLNERPRQPEEIIIKPVEKNHKKK